MFNIVAMYREQYSDYAGSVPCNTRNSLRKYYNGDSWRVIHHLFHNICRDDLIEDFLEMDSKEEAVLVMMIRDIVMPTLCTWLQLITREVCCRLKKNTDTVCSWLGDISKEL